MLYQWLDIFSVNILFTATPVFAVTVLAGPLLLLKFVLKKKLGLINTVLALVLGALLSALFLYAVFYAVLYSAGYGFRQTYGGSL